ncbi:MAG: TlpA family protein disulfide reductase [Chitinophagaceae bacterium]|nr:TlpA family protein disulfide reductase [Chitinophagaceae bacterium]
MKKITLTILMAIAGLYTMAQAKATTTQFYKGTLVREDGNEIVFNFELRKKNGKPVIYIINGMERFRVDGVRMTADSVFIKMPLFESYFKAAVSNNNWTGVWIKETSKGTQQMPFVARLAATRFPLTEGTARVSITGRWEADFASDSGAAINAVAEFQQKGNTLTGSFLTSTGDYRYLSGIVTGNKLKLSTFDGGHAFLFTADVSGKNKITNGKFYSGKTFVDDWTAKKKSTAIVPPNASAMYLKPGETSLNFRFPDLDSNLVSINDDRFKNKVVVIQLMGSWCPNCMDETAFLSEYYTANKNRGVEVLGLAYEYTSNFERAKQGLLKFKNRFNVQYPLLFTGVSITDELRTEKTLPQVTPIKVFPSSIIIDKKGVVRKLDNGFYGPGTGIHYKQYKKEFHDTINRLLSE